MEESFSVYVFKTVLNVVKKLVLKLFFARRRHLCKNQLMCLIRRFCALIYFAESR